MLGKLSYATEVLLTIVTVLPMASIYFPQHPVAHFMLELDFCLFIKLLLYCSFKNPNFSIYLFYSYPFTKILPSYIIISVILVL